MQHTYKYVHVSASRVSLIDPTLSELAAATLLRYQRRALWLNNRLKSSEASRATQAAAAAVVVAVFRCRQRGTMSPEAERAPDKDADAR